MLVQGPNVTTTVRSLTLGGETGAAATLQLSGTSTAEFRAIGEIRIAPLGRLALRDGRSLTARDIEIRGRILVEAGDSQISGAVVNSGLISIGAGSAATFLSEVTGDGSVVVSTGSTVTFAESYFGSRIGGPGSVVFHGAVTPQGAERKLLIDGEATLGETAVLEITLGGNIAGSLHDSVVFQGHVALGGTLSLTAANGNIPPVNQSFTLLQYASRSGQFDLVEFDHSLPSGLDWAITYTTTGVELTTSALPGDIDLDGNVDRSDLALLTANLGMSTGATWTTGDLNADGATSLHDLMLLRNLLGASAAASASTPVPEPAMHWMAVAMLGCVAVRSANSCRTATRMR